MEKQMNLKEQMAAFKRGDFVSYSTKVQCEAGWYDWFCRDDSLQPKTYKLYPKVEQIMGSTRFDNEKVYVFFKNNCPMDGSLYDDFRICDLETGDVLFTVSPSQGYTSLKEKRRQGLIKGTGAIWGKDNDFEEALLEGATWPMIRKWFLEEQLELSL